MHKHSSMGCAVVSMQSAAMREAAVREMRAGGLLPRVAGLGLAAAAALAQAIMNFAEHVRGAEIRGGAAVRHLLLLFAAARWPGSAGARSAPCKWTSARPGAKKKHAAMRRASACQERQVKVQLKRHTDMQTKREAVEILSCVSKTWLCPDGPR